jgi:hypothetical protein
MVVLVYPRSSTHKDVFLSRGSHDENHQDHGESRIVWQAPASRGPHIVRLVGREEKETCCCESKASKDIQQAIATIPLAD